VFVPELFPTHLRGTSFGFVSATARIGGLLAPLVIHLHHYHEMIPALILGAISFIGAITRYIYEFDFSN
jgi:sugar phosphate permease